MFVNCLEAHGRNWKLIASLIPTRTVVQIRTHAQKFFQKLEKVRHSRLRVRSIVTVHACDPAVRVIPQLALFVLPGSACGEPPVAHKSICFVSIDSFRLCSPCARSSTDSSRSNHNRALTVPSVVRPR